MPEPHSESHSLAPLLTPEGWALLNSLDTYEPDRALELNDKLRRAGHCPEVVSAVLTQSRLRARAATKFGDFAKDMLFTEAGLEQATRLPVAARHAQRFAQVLGPQGNRRIVDLGCGIGADSLAFATLDLNVTAVDIDELAAACATVNLMPFPNAVVQQAEATTVDLSDADAVWLDPARRHTGSSGTQRLFDPEAFSPSLSFASDIADRGLPTGVKIGPGIPHASLPDSAETQWTSVNGELVEATLWFNAVARPGVRRSALVLRSMGTKKNSAVSALQEFNSAELSSPVPYEPGQQDPPLGEIGEYLYEPDSAVIRAGLVADLARTVEMHLFDPQIAYLGSAASVDTPFARGYRVLEVLPYHLKTLRSWLRERRIEILDIKKRGTAVSPEELRQQLLPGTKTKAKTAANQPRSDSKRRGMTLVMTRIGDKRYAIAVEPLAGSSLVG
ncbi:methyltransferase [Acaricomes phytoseiuli]|uniref:class I SAM-dependent methyltransferase n=1 Tax=Acaricomes phytoseiuli TaxID=291968 RepID=UPI000368B325|nr:class I SAM-dependent methyltransferase [Acaricomes phytoseiuli]MCW1250110.1 methyltransferase [Acaricomes phytoseiuli]